MEFAMRQVMVRYKVKPERVAENERFVAAVFSELEQTQPTGLSYATFRLPDGVSFMHLASLDTQDGSNPLPSLSAFRQFVANIAERCEEPPVTTELATIGAFHTFH
jgi:hypothetical protein